MLVKYICTGCFLLCLLFASPSYAQGDLFINPKRIVFEGSKISQEISLANIGNDTSRYVVSFVQIRLKDDGNFQIIEEPDSGQRFADKNLRIFPRTVELAPKETQTVKIQVYQKNKLLTGEYRSHLYFRAAKENKPLDHQQAKDTSSKVVIKITPVYGITIPVIIRVGENTGAITLSHAALELQESAYFVNIRLNRTGNMSIYGDLRVNYISDTGKILEVGYIKGISVYTPNTKRDVKIELNKMRPFDHHKGKLRITYTVSEQVKEITSTELLLR